MSYLDDIVYLFENNAITGGATGWTAYKEFTPEGEDNLVVIYSTGGTGAQTKDLNSRDVDFQIALRGTANDLPSTENKLEAIKQLLIAQKNTIINSVSYAGIVEVSERISTGRDDNNRPQLVQNFKAFRNA